jgi:hypothetical protein
MIVTSDMITIQTRKDAISTRVFIPRSEHPNIVEGEYSVDVALIAKVIKQLPQGQFSTEDGELSFNDENTSIRLNPTGTKAFISLFKDFVVNTSSKIDYNKMVKGLQTAAKYTSKDSESILSNVYVAGNKIYSTDKHVLSEYNVGSKVGYFIIPTDVIKLLEKLPTSKISFGINEKQTRVLLSMECEQYTLEIIYSIYRKTYPILVQNVFGKLTHDNPYSIDSQEFKKALKLYSTLSKSNTINLEFTKNLTLKAEDESTEITHTIPCTGKYPSVVVYLLSVLNSFIPSITDKTFSFSLKSNKWRFNRNHQVIILPFAAKDEEG